ncbi:MAG: hypothetical protein ACKPEO_14730 [Sphaerospermopsis kisseleviana]
MKAIINDVEILNHLQPQQIDKYLKSKGWHEQGVIPNKVSIWIQDNYSENKLKIQLPVDQNFDDYSQRIYDVIETLSKAEKRSQFDILGEIITDAPNLTIQAVVSQIQTPSATELKGEIQLFGVVFDKLRQIKTILENHDYILAIKAYQERLPIRCTGDLFKENDQFILQNPHNFQIDNI